MDLNDEKRFQFLIAQEKLGAIFTFFYRASCESRGGWGIARAKIISGPNIRDLLRVKSMNTVGSRPSPSTSGAVLGWGWNISKGTWRSALGDCFVDGLELVEKRGHILLASEDLVLLSEKLDCEYPKLKVLSRSQLENIQRGLEFRRERGCC